MPQASIARRYAESPRLPDQITVHHGPRERLARFFLEADLAARSRGVHLYLHADLSSLVEFNRRAPNWGTLVPIFRPDCGLVTSESAFWIEGRTASGETVATQAGRLFEWPRSTLVEEFGSLRALYADPEPRREAGERWTVTAPSAGRITGRVTFSGAGWYHPAFRGIGLSSILPRISRLYAFTRWNTDYTISMVDPVLTRKGVVASYGYTRIEKEVALRGSFRGDTSFDLVWMPQAELLADLDAYLSIPAAKRVRSTEAPETKVAPSLLRQGRSRRS
ncbi:MAG TPA: hypothetical protein VFA50_18765 [Stellaceae bacterium]|nr:hypothetical protein [Stellaceae bacterium]